MLPDLTTNMSINGPGATVLTVRRDTGGNYRIFNNTATVTIAGLTVSNGSPTGDNGGGILNSGTLTLNNSTVSGNSASSVGAVGGGIRNAGTLIINNSTIDGNSANNQGGGLSNGGGATIDNSTFSGNGATAGAGMYNTATLTVNNSTLSGNSATNNGGGIQNEGTLTFRNSTIFGNTATTGRGGGIRMSSGSLTLSSSIIAGNSGFTAGPDMEGSSSSGDYNLLQNTTDASLAGSNNITGVSPMVDALSNYGGPTQTHRLQSGSPARDKGVSNSFTTDQRGSFRTADDPLIANATGGDGTDIGSFELDNTQTGTTFTVNTTDDLNDGSCTLGHCSLREAVNAANGNGDTTTITFLSGLTGTITLGSELVLSTPMSINGPGVSVITVSGGNVVEVFDVTSSVNISDLTIANGKGGSGGGIRNLSTLTVNRIYFTGNDGPGAGGALFNSGTLTVMNCTFVLNTGSGGAAIAQNNGTSTFVNSTVSGNNSAASGPVYIAGGTLNLVNTTISNNTSPNGGGIRNVGGTINLRNTIVAGNTATFQGPDLHGSFVSQGNNFIGKSDFSTGFTDGVNNDQVGTIASPKDPMLDALGNYGGSTLTHRLQVTSTAIDAANNCVYDNTCSPAYGFSVTTDQRGAGFWRKVDGNSDANYVVDIGAYEFETANQVQFAAANTNDAETNSGSHVVNIAVKRVGGAAGAISVNYDVTDGTATTADSDYTVAPATGVLNWADGDSADKVIAITVNGDTTYEAHEIVNLGLSSPSGASLGAPVSATLTITNDDPVPPAATFTVNTLDDNDFGACVTSHCSLREAVNAANGNGDTTTITFLSGLTGTITLGSELVLSTPMSINGPGVSVITVSGGNVVEVFDVTSSVNISDLTIANGKGGSGGGIRNLSTLTVNRIYFTGNDGPGAGGALFNSGTLTVMNCTFVLNTGSGGAAIAQNNGTSTFVNSTVSGNNSAASGPVYIAGGTLNLVNTTISNNTSPNGGGIRNVGGTIDLRNTIVAGNTATFQGPDLHGSFVSQGNNFIGKSDFSTGFTDGVNNDQVGTIASPKDPMLDALGNYGGPTLTHRLQVTSTAIDAGNNCVYDNTCSPAYGFSITTDQRGIGFDRKLDGDGDSTATVDIGAYEALPQGAALDFDGTDDFVQSSSSPALTGSGARTVEFWAQVDNPGAGGFLFGQGTSGTGTLFALGYSANKLVFYGYNTDYDTDYVIDTCWHHYAVTYDGTTVKTYVDGYPTPVTNQVIPLNTTGDPLYVGSWINSPTDGRIDEFRVWNVERTQSEIQGAKDTELVGNEAGLEIYYNFNQGTAGGNNAGVTTLNDSAGTANNGALTNFALTGTSSNWVTSGAFALAPEINVKGNGVSILDGDGSPDVADDTDFGSTSVSAGTVTRTFTIENLGTAVLNLGTNAVSITATPISPSRISPTLRWLWAGRLLLT